jgi:hypothetical protein
MGSIRKVGKIIIKPDFFKKPRIINPKAMRECTALHPNCRVCGSQNQVSAHHIHSRGERGDDAMSNLISLCFSCHRHAEDGIYITKKDKVEYVNARNYMISVLEMLHDKRYEKAIEYLRSKNAD